MRRLREHSDRSQTFFTTFYMDVPTFNLRLQQSLHVYSRDDSCRSLKFEHQNHCEVERTPRLEVNFQRNKVPQRIHIWWISLLHKINQHHLQQLLPLNTKYVYFQSHIKPVLDWHPSPDLGVFRLSHCLNGSKGSENLREGGVGEWWQKCSNCKSLHFGYLDNDFFFNCL